MSAQKIERISLSALDADDHFEDAMAQVVAAFFSHIEQCEKGGEGGPLATKDGCLEATVTMKIVVRTNVCTLGTDATVGVDLKLPGRKSTKVALLARSDGFLVPEDEGRRQLPLLPKEVK